MSDRTIIKPRPGGRILNHNQADQSNNDAESANNDKTRLSSGAINAEHHVQQPMISISDNILIDDAGDLLSLLTSIRQTKQHADISSFKTQCVQLITRYEQLLRHKKVPSRLIESARYCMCSVIDEAILNTAWGGESDWATESLLSTFHNETFGGEYFFTLLDAAISHPIEHLPLLELQYLCLSLGFEGKMRIAPRGFEQLEHYRDRAYKAIRSARSEPPSELSPGWRSKVDVSNAVETNFPMWVSVSLLAAIMLGIYMYMNFQINNYSDAVHRQLNSLVSWQPDGTASNNDNVRQNALRLQQILQTEIGKQLLSVDELQDRVRIRVGLDQLFSTGSTGINDQFLPVVVKIARALEGTDGRILVSGYTDDIPIFTSKYPSNWHLSLARANAMAEALASGADLRGRLWPEGHGETNPLVSNDSPENRAINRRVEIELLP